MPQMQERIHQQLVRRTVVQAVQGKRSQADREFELRDVTKKERHATAVCRMVRKKAA